MQSSEIEKLKASVTEEVEAHRHQLSELSLKIHSNPELGFQEVKAAEWLTHVKVNGGVLLNCFMTGPLCHREIVAAPRIDARAFVRTAPKKQVCRKSLNKNVMSLVDNDSFIDAEVILPADRNGR